MATLDLGGETFDLVWAEGSAFVMGVREALTAWREFLKPGGALGFTELVWLEDGVPDECREFFQGQYPPMTDVAGNLAIIADCGYELVDRFTVPESSWTELYCGPLAERLEVYEVPPGDDAAQAVFEMCRREIDMNRRFSKWYGYEFFLLRFRG